MKPCALVLALGILLMVGCVDSPQPPKTEDMTDAIRLKARVFVPVAGVDKGLERYFEKRAEAQKTHVLVQFAVVPDLKKRQGLAE